MNKPDVLFLDIYQSICGGWGTGVIQRGEMMIELLPQTSLSDEIKKWFAGHLPDMITEFKENPTYFDGRSWARDSTWNYDRLMESEWFDKEFYAAHTIYNSGTEIEGYEKFLETFPAFNDLHWEIVIEQPTAENVRATREAVEEFLREGE